MNENKSRAPDSNPKEKLVSSLTQKALAELGDPPTVSLNEAVKRALHGTVKDNDPQRAEYFTEILRGLKKEIIKCNRDKRRLNDLMLTGARQNEKFIESLGLDKQASERGDD